MVWWAAVFAFGAVVVAFGRFVYLKRAFKPTGADLLEQVRRLRRDQLAALLDTLPEGSDARALVDAAVSTTDADARSASVDEAMLDVEGKLRKGQGVPKTAARVAMLSGNAFAVLELLSSLPSPNMQNLLRIAACLIFGSVGAFAAAFCARFAARERERQADAWYETARRLAAHEAGPVIPAPEGGQGVVSGREGG